MIMRTPIIHMEARTRMLFDASLVIYGEYLGRISSYDGFWA